MIKMANEEFARGYSAGMRSMLISINEGGPDDFEKGDDPLKVVSSRKSMSDRLRERILTAVGLK